ncbi:hypothetical protein K2173_001261 [Erythroxylum novogranatense]|uniref:C2H2-type domain-containing protein n=1 Tax=Erythroxylum novogranatense TaxID=1862640 RepID=A0AAV8T4M1_9ROSI|nr:hypothetical protein K2173_001261 [Erythroxylum novogranatense]
MASVRFARLPSLPRQETLFPLQFAYCRRTITIPLLSIITSRCLPPVRCSIDTNNTDYKNTLRTCKNCKYQFDPSLNHPHACRFHTAHFGGETKRKFESVYSGGTLNTPDSGRIFEYWHCCGSEDPFDPGCTAAPHVSYDE